MPFNSPVSAEKITRLLRVLDLNSESRAVDFGCGNGEFLFALQRQSGASCLGIDLDASLIAAGNNRLVALPNAGIEFRQSDVTSTSMKGELFDLTVCMGSSHAFAQGQFAYESALATMKKLLKPNAMMLIGEGYWKKDPDPEYLEILGEPVGIYNSFEENISIAESAGLTPVYATESNLDEWDDFEWNFLMKAERAALSNPADSGLKEKLAHARAWNASYTKFGRSTMGYAHYIFMNT